MSGHARKAVVILFHPPESLRDCRDLEFIRAVLYGNGQQIIEALAQEVMRSWTSEPIGVGDANALVDAAIAQRDEVLAERRKQEAGG